MLTGGDLWPSKKVRLATKLFNKLLTDSLLLALDPLREG